jgi:TolA-binding protein
MRAAAAGEFRAAIDLLEAGQNLEAAAAFARFSARHPRDARAEDAAYLRVLALVRAGARADAESAALRYLHDHPAGLRRVEVGGIAHPARAEGQGAGESR